MKSVKNIFSCLVLFAYFLVAPFYAEAAGPAKGPSPVRIEADHMMSDQKNNSVFFSGKVEAKRDDIVIHADEMTVYYVGEKEQQRDDGGRNINRLHAIGNVEITKGEWVAVGDTAEYFENERKIVLIGNTKVWQESNLVTGDKFIFYLDEGKSIVESSAKKNERVKAFFYPDADKSE